MLLTLSSSVFSDVSCDRTTFDDHVGKYSVALLSHTFEIYEHFDYEQANSDEFLSFT